MVVPWFRTTEMLIDVRCQLLVPPRRQKSHPCQIRPLTTHPLLDELWTVFRLVVAAMAPESLLIGSPANDEMDWWTAR